MDEQQAKLYLSQAGAAFENRAGDSLTETTRQLQENELVRRAQLGNHGAFNSLFHSYNQQICKYLFRLVNNIEVASDLAQDTFLAAWQALPCLPPHIFFRPWLYKIATHKAISWWRKQNHVHWTAWEEQEIAQNTNLSPSSGFEAQIDMSELIQKVLRMLPGDQRVCLLLQSVGGFKIHEIALMLDMNPKTVSVYISRAREQFRQTYTRLQSENDLVTKGDQS